MLDKKIMGEILGILRKYETFLISSHINPEGDALGSQLAIYSLLSDMGKKVSVIGSDPVPFAYTFLPNAAVLKCIKSIPDVEVAVIVDCGNLNRVGEELAKHIHPSKALINIDHHGSNDYFGTHNLVDANACSTGEIIFKLMEYGDMEISLDQAICLYAAILTDTGSFRYPNATADAHRITAQLIDIGVNPAQVAESIYETIPYERVKLLGMALERLQVSSDGKIVWTAVTSEMYERAGAKSEDTEGIIDYIRSLRNVDVAIFFRELEDGSIKVSMRSKRGLDVAKVAGKFGGGGHKAAAGCTISEPLNKVIDIILGALGSTDSAGILT